MNFFSDFHGGAFSRQKSVETAHGVKTNSLRWARNLLRNAIPEGLTRAELADLRFILGLDKAKPRTSHASNLALRRPIIDQVIASMLGIWAETMGREMQLLTITPDEWHIHEKRPELCTPRWRADAGRWMTNLGITGLGVVELQPFLNHPTATEGRVISAHLHIMGFADDPYTFDARVAKFSQSNARRCSIGAFAVTRPIKLTEADIAMVAYYLFEPLHWAKRLTPSRTSEGKLKHRHERLPFHLAMRCAEIMSYISITDLIVTRGRVAWNWRQELIKAAQLAKSDYVLDANELDRLWSSVWAKGKNREYERVSVLA